MVVDVLEELTEGAGPIFSKELANQAGVVSLGESSFSYTKNNGEGFLDFSYNGVNYNFRFETRGGQVFFTGSLRPCKQNAPISIDTSKLRYSNTSLEATQYLSTRRIFEGNEGVGVQCRLKKPLKNINLAELCKDLTSFVVRDLIRSVK